MQLVIIFCFRKTIHSKSDNKRIKKCIGCGSQFTRKMYGSLPDPPNDLDISREERRPFKDVHNEQRLSRLQNVHSHATIGCIKRLNSLLSVSDLQIPDDLELLHVHHKYLQDQFGLT